MPTAYLIFRICSNNLTESYLGIYSEPSPSMSDVSKYKELLIHKIYADDYQTAHFQMGEYVKTCLKSGILRANH